MALQNSSGNKKSRKSSSGSGIIDTTSSSNKPNYDLDEMLRGLSQPADRILEMIETAKINDFESARKIIANALGTNKISSSDAKAMIVYMTEYFK